MSVVFFSAVPLWMSAAAQVIPWWVWLILILILIILLVIFWLERSRSSAEPPEEPVAQLEKTAPTRAVEAKPAAAGQKDDLARIEGIGPKISSVLQAAGISTFAQLAQTPPEKITEILLAANLRLADPGTWSAQARLAAEGKWDELQTFQNSLKGGRKA